MEKQLEIDFEEWRPVVGYVGLYEVSSFGRVRSLGNGGANKYKGNGRILSQSLGNTGYYRVHLCKNNADNLEWSDQKYNVNYGTAIERKSKKLINHPSHSKKVDRYDLDGNYIDTWPSTMEVQRVLGIQNPNVSACCLGKVKTAGGFKWKYAS